MLTLRPYQREALDALYGYWREGGGNALIVLPTGAGKSLCLAALCQELLASYPTLRIAVVTHVKELIQQNFLELLRLWPAAQAGIYSAGIGRRDARAKILFCGIQSVHNKTSLLGAIDVLLVDECFVGTTQIETPLGVTKIEQLKVGQIVKNAIGYGIIEAISKRESKSLVRLELSNGITLRCTENHPFFTSFGWIRAGALEIGSLLYSAEDMRKLQGRFSSFYRDEGASLDQAEILFNLLFEVERESNVRSSHARKNECYFEKNWTSDKGKGREWARLDELTRGVTVLVRERMGGGNSNYDNEKSAHRKSSKKLQDRSSQFKFDDCNRSGWRFSRYIKEEESGSSEGKTPQGIRVESISREECKRHEIVYNLQVSGHPSYFAGGALVHNCHLIPRNTDTTYGRFITSVRADTPDCRVVGLTATPYRMSSGRLDRGEGRIFDQIVYDANVADLIEQDYLSPIISKATAQKLDVTGVAKRGGEYVPGALEIAVDHDWITRNAAEEIARFGVDRKAWLVFCSGVKHAEHVRDAIRLTGASCEMVVGETPSHERDRCISQFRAGKIRCLTSVGVLGTGFNVPHVDMIALLRPTQSAGLFVQQCGRGLRKAPGKKNCLILDFSGLTKLHGPIDQITTTGNGSDKTTGDPLAKECPKCATLVALAARQCPDCGYEWPPRDELLPRHEATADAHTSIISKGSPVWVDVNEVRYYRHEKPGSPASLRAEYHCGLTVHKEWVCLSHNGFARQKAEAWWQRVGQSPIPRNTEDALTRVEELRSPSQIQVRPDGKFFQITARRFERVEAMV